MHGNAMLHLTNGNSKACSLKEYRATPVRKAAVFETTIGPASGGARVMSSYGDTAKMGQAGCRHV
jgi:hypothetical protein